MSQPRLLAIELEGFRGFAETQRLDLDADAIVIRGDNGSGKTSLVDGLLWLFCGELRHLTDRVKGLRRTEDAVTNRFHGSAARVRLEVRSSGRDYSFTRTGDERRTTLTCLLDENPVKDAEGVLAKAFGHTDMSSLQQAIVAWGLLRQDAISAALDLSGGALHERLSGIIGLERVTAFATAATSASDTLIRERTAARAALKRATERYSGAVERRDLARKAASASEDAGVILRRGLSRVSAVLPPGVSISIDDPSLEAVAEFGQFMRQLIDAFEAKHERIAALAARERDSDAAVQAAEAAMESAGRHAVDASERAPASAQLAALALGMLGDRCPVCDQTIDEETVREHLEEMRASAERLATSAQQAQDALARAQAELAEIRERARQRSEAEEALRVARAATAELLERAKPRLAVASEPPDDDRSRELLEGLRQARDRLAELYRDAQSVGGAHLAQLENEVEALGGELGTAQAEVDLLESRSSQAKSLEHAAHQAAENIVQRALSTLQPSFAEVFDRLNPNPAFTELLARQDVFRNQNQVVPVVRDRERNIDANPLLVFSEGQLNVVALSYFLGMALNAQEAIVPFLVLDDPLQALDVVAILGFADLCRRIREERQLIVTTHDRRFADVLVRKLSPREPNVRTIVHEFEGWTREGPSIRTDVPDVAEVIPLLRRRAS